MIRIAPEIAIEEREIEESFIRAPGSGGQHVNKTLRPGVVDMARSVSLSALRAPAMASQ